MAHFSILLKNQLPHQSVLGPSAPRRRPPLLSLLLSLLLPLLLLTLLFSSNPIHGQEAAPATLQERELPVVYETLSGRISSMLTPISQSDQSFALEGEQTPIEDLIAIEFSGKEADSSPYATVHLRGGGFWKGRIDRRRLGSDSSDELIYWNSPSLSKALPIPIDSLESFIAAGEPANLMVSESSENDVLLTKDGARLIGILEKFGSDKITFDDESLGILQVEWAKVRGFKLVSLTDSDPQPSESFKIHISTRDGSVPQGQLLTLNSEALSFSIADGSEVAIPIDRILKVTFQNKRVQPLADREPIKVEEGLGPDRWFPWTWQKNRNVLGNGLRIGARNFDLGIGVHSNSLLTFAIEAGDSSLSGFAGMDSSSRPKDDEPEIGCARFSILVDGDCVWGPHDLSWQDAPLPFKIDLSGKTSVSLKVEMGSGHHILDRANWVSTRIFKE